MSSVPVEVSDTASSNPDGYSVQVQSQDDDNKAYREHLLPTLQRRDSPGSAVKHLPGGVGGGVSGSSYLIGDELSGTSFHGDEFSSTTTEKGDEQQYHDSSIYDSPAPHQIEQFIEEVVSTINADMSKFPDAHGLVVTFSNKTCPSAEDELPNIRNSSKRICSAFSQFGYVCSVFYECCRAKYLAVFKALTTRIQLPNSYKMLFVYFAGHGQKDFVGVHDGFVSVSKLKGLLDSDNPITKRIPKVLFLDCCRRDLTGKLEKLDSSVENLLIVNTTRLYRRAYLDNSEGMGVGTSEFINLLERHQESWSFHDLIARFISAVKGTYRRISEARAQQPHLSYPEDEYTSLWPDYEGCLDHYPNLYRDKLMAMMPTELVLDQQSLKLTMKIPVHARHHEFRHFFVETKSRHSQDWVKDFPKLTSTELQLSMEQLAGKKFRVGATYKNGIEVVGQDIVYYEFGDLKPTRVQVKKISRDQAEISWVESDNLFLYDRNSGHQFILVGKKKLHANTDYNEFKKIEDVGQCSHVIHSQEAEENEFAIQYHVNGRSSMWTEAERIYCDQQSYGFLQDLKVSLSNRDNFTVQWEESPHFEDIEDKETYIAIKVREGNSTQWVDFQTNIKVCDRACTISADIVGNPEFMVELFEDRNKMPHLIESHIVSYNQQELESCENDQNEQHPSRTKALSRCCILFFIVLFCTISTYAALVFVFVNYSYGFAQFSITHLGVASDVIDCEDTNSLKRYVYSSLSVTQRALLANQVDNPHLEIDVFSIPYSGIIYHSFLWSGESTIEIKHGNESGPSVIPDDYYNRPWYLRSQSNISLQFNMESNEPPLKMALYLFDNEDDLNSFMRDPDSTPQYVRMINLLASKQDPYFSIHESSYYYVVADIRTNSKIKFSAEVTFNILYIDDDDYPSAYKRHIGSNGGTVNVPVDVFGHNLTLCAISPLPDDSVDPHTTHIEITYNVRVLATVFIAIILVSILILISIPFCCIAKCCLCKSQNDRIDDASVPLMHSSSL